VTLFELLLLKESPILIQTEGQEERATAEMRGQGMGESRNSIANITIVEFRVKCAGLNFELIAMLDLLKSSEDLFLVH
jgi:hypothetical protein